MHTHNPTVEHWGNVIGTVSNKFYFSNTCSYGNPFLEQYTTWFQDSLFVNGSMSFFCLHARVRPPGVSGTREHGHWEHENKRKIKLGTWEQKHILGNREHQNRRKTFREDGNTRKSLLGAKEHGPPPPPSWETLRNLHAYVICLLHERVIQGQYHAQLTVPNWFY